MRGPRKLAVVMGIFSMLFIMGHTYILAQTQAQKDFLFAQGLYEEGKFELAAEQFQRFINNYPENENCDRAQYGIGMSFWQIGNYL